MKCKLFYIFYYLKWKGSRIKEFQSFRVSETSSLVHLFTSPLVHLSTCPLVSAFLLQPERKKGIGDAELVVLFFEYIEIGQAFVRFLYT